VAAASEVYQGGVFVRREVAMHHVAKHLTTEMQACIDSCMECHAACEETITHCLQQGGDYATVALIRALTDCADMCRMCADMMMRGSEFASAMCRVCADVCMRCADECARMSDDEQLMGCADMCRRTAEMCRQMDTAAA
jgi:hypothetical protein